MSRQVSNVEFKGIFDRTKAEGIVYIFEPAPRLLAQRP